MNRFIVLIVLLLCSAGWAANSQITLTNIDTMQTASSWTADASVTISDDATTFVQGTKSMKFVTATAGAVGAYKDITFNAQGGIGIAIRLTKVCDFRTLWIKLYEDAANADKYYQFYYNSQTSITTPNSYVWMMYDNEWLYMWFPSSYAAKSGTGTSWCTTSSNGIYPVKRIWVGVQRQNLAATAWASGNFYSMDRVTYVNPTYYRSLRPHWSNVSDHNTPPANTTDWVSIGNTCPEITVNVGDIVTFNNPKAILLLGFDDGRLSPYTIAFPQLKSRGYHATTFVIPSLVVANTAGSATVANLTDEYNAGWDIASHGWAHTTNTGTYHITSFAAGAGGDSGTHLVVTTSEDVYYAANTPIEIVGTTNYNGIYLVHEYISAKVFHLLKAYVANDATGYVGTPLTSVQSELTDSQKWLIANKFLRGSRIHAWRGNAGYSVNSDTGNLLDRYFDVVRGQSRRTTRTGQTAAGAVAYSSGNAGVYTDTWSSSNKWDSPIPTDWRSLGYYDLGATGRTKDQFISDLDILCGAGGVMGVFIHSIGADQDKTEADWNLILAAIDVKVKAGLLDVLTYSEWYDRVNSVPKIYDRNVLRKSQQIAPSYRVRN